MKNYSLLVTSCDGFADAWEPFFKLYARFWNDPELKIYLVTETKSISYPGIQINCTQVNRDTNRQLTWGETVISSLEQVETDIILMYMDDFFIHAPVNKSRIDEIAGLLQGDPGLDAVYLSASGPKDCYPVEKETGLCRVRQFSDYKVSMQACLWKKEVLLSLLKESENAWMFELFGTKRAHLKRLNFLKIADPKDNPIPYINTGITKGKWNPEVVPVFEKNGISIDFKKRGFFGYQNKWAIKFTTFRTLIRNPLLFGYHYFILPAFARVKSLFTTV